MRLDEDEARRRFAAGPVARLATVRPDGTPHVVPVVVALSGGDVVMSVDHKPKRSTRLQRVENLRAQPRCSLLVDEYHEDWSRLWWVRADGRGTVIDRPGPADPGIEALVERHAPYRERPPTGPLVRVTVDRWVGWAAGPDAG